MYFDVILIGDLRVPGGTSRHLCNEIRVLSQAGHSVGLVNVELPHARGQKPLDPLIRARLAAGEATLVQTELYDLEAGLVIFENPRAFMQPPPPDLRVRARQGLIALHFPARDGTGAPTFDPARVLQVCGAITDAPLSWAPTSRLTREMLMETHPGLRLMDGMIPCIVFADEFQVERPPRPRPVIGRHSRPQLDKWPGTRKQILQAYPASKDVDVVLLGTSDELRRLVGSYPRNWHTHEFNEISPTQLLEQIDFFVYHHHPRWIEAFGMSVAEAMASGAVAILPEYMRSNFGDGAVYGTPAQTLTLVRALHRDKAEYKRQARRGRDFIRRHHSPAAYLAALKGFLITRSRQQPGAHRTLRTDVAILADMRRSGVAALRVKREVEATVAAGYATTLLHCPAGEAGGRVRPEIQGCVREGKAAVADLAQQDVTARLLVVHGVEAFLSLGATPARNLRADKVLIVVDEALSAGEIELTRRLLHGMGQRRIVWAPTSEAIRLRLEAHGVGLALTVDNWRPICPIRPRVMRTKRKARTLAVIAKDVFGVAELQRLKELLPHDGSLQVRLHGAPRDKTMQPLLPLPGWETFKSHEISLDKFLDGADALLCMEGLELAEVAVAEASARGMPVVATPALRRELGDTALYYPAERAGRELTKLLASSRRYAVASRAAAARAAHAYAPDRHALRLAELIGVPRKRMQPRPRRGMPKRVLMFSQNGVGLGHVVRQLAVSNELSRSHDVVFCSMSQAIDVIAGQGYAVEHLPSHVYSGVSYADWHGWARAQLEQMLDFYGVGAVVLDGSVPYLGLIEAVAPRDDVRLVWMRRPMWPNSPDGHLRLAQQRFFDLVIEPEEAAGEMDTGPTVAHRAQALCVPPIRLLEPRQLLPRAAAAAALKLDPSRPAVLVQLGSGTNHDIATLTERIVLQARAYPDLQVAIAEWHNSDQPLDLWEGVTCLRGFPYSRYFNAFDFSFAAAGYNSFHEILAFGLPTAFIPNPRDYMDGQATRAAFAAERGASLVCDASAMGIGAAFQQLMEAKTRRRMRVAMRRLARPNGARAAADAIAALMRDAS